MKEAKLINLDMLTPELRAMIEEALSSVDWADITNKPQLADSRWKSPVADYVSLPMIDNTAGDLRLVLTPGDVYQWSGSAWVLIGANDTSLLWEHITNKPDTFTPSAHAHDMSDVTGLNTALAGKVDDSQVLTDVPAGAVFTDTVYTHPADHPATMIVEDADHRFVTDVEKAAWTSGIGGDPYVHPPTHPQSMIVDLETDLAGKAPTAHGHAFSEITGTASEAQVGDRTINDAIVTAYANTGSISQILSWFGKIIKTIVGGSNWYSTPPTSLTALNTKFEGVLTTTKEPTGFVDNANVIVTYDSVTRKVTLTGTVEAYFKGARVTELVSGWVSQAHAAVYGGYYLHYTDSGFVFNTTPWLFDSLMIAYVQYNSVSVGLREPHGVMPWQAHKEFHETIGTYRQSGGSLSAYTLASTTTANRRPDVAATVVQDEDIATTISALSNKLYTQRFLTGAGVRSFNLDQSDIIANTANVPYWNQFTGGNWVQTPFSNNDYGAVFIVAVPTTADAQSQKLRYMFVQPQQVGTLDKIEALTSNNLVHGDSAALVTEFVFIGKIIIQMTGNNWVLSKVELLAGTRLGQSATVSGSFLTAVSHDATLTGAGTPASPLSVVSQTTGAKVTASTTAPSSPTTGDVWIDTN